MTRQAKFLWMKEILEHLDDCHRQWQFADGRAEQYLAEAIKRDLEEVRRLCESLRSEPACTGRPCAVAAA
jgi:hypothetical protein